MDRNANRPYACLITDFNNQTVYNLPIITPALALGATTALITSDVKAGVLIAFGAAATSLFGVSMSSLHYIYKSNRVSENDISAYREYKKIRRVQIATYAGAWALYAGALAFGAYASENDNDQAQNNPPVISQTVSKSATPKPF